mmetsp:Transcript_8197/g.10051  ORF Transcript_8197/g.10051 Transcript_8197/m.10051 type:complete len:484 (+) Transcript_8197:89-1540(+)
MTAAPMETDQVTAPDEARVTSNPYMKKREDAPQDDAYNNKTSIKEEEHFSIELLGMYYSRLFPHSFLHNWLSYNSPSLFSRREFSFTKESNQGDEIYLRYQSFGTAAELKTAIIKQRPHKIDIGAVFNFPPKNHNAIDKSNFNTVQRELVFDIDLTDYDDVRHCGCQNALICHKCWVFMTMAIKVVSRGLRTDFGFRHIAWFYSGRRGVHCWVCDETARELSNEARNAIVSYFEVALNQNKSVDLGGGMLHPLLRKSYETLLPGFVESVLPMNGHGLLADPEKWKELLHTLPPAANAIIEKLTEKFDEDGDETTPEDKWNDILKHVTIFLKTQSKARGKSAKLLSSADKTKLEHWKYETVLKHTYPRLDINVSKMQNHLLKSPFCVHPKTGRVCVPIDERKVDEFDPLTVPTLGQLQRELDEAYSKDKAPGDGSSVMEEDWKRTSLKESFEYFETGVLAGMKKEWRRVKREEMDERDAAIGDF